MSLEGQRLGEFEILERLGQGGMGAVYKARQVTLDRLVALKTLQAAIAADPEYIARFSREAKAAAVLNHPNLVQVYSAGETDGLHWFAMEFVEGESRADRLKRKGRLDPEEAIAIATHVATALEYGWRKAHLIHRDIKPDNIFLSTDGEVKLGDLGLAKSAGESQSLTVTGSSMGTPNYVSPEQGQGKKDVDLRADIYSIGCTLFHLVSGEAPFKGDTALAVMMQHVTAPVPNLRSVWPECPEELARVVMKMMLKQPGARQQSYGEVIADLRRAYDALTSATMPARVDVTQQPAAQRHGKRQPPVAQKLAGAKKGLPVAALAGGGLALLAAIVALFWFAPWKKGGQLSEAERMEKEHPEHGNTRTTGGTASAAPPKFSVSYPQPAKWIDETANVRSAGLKQEALAVDGEWLEARKAIALPLGDGRKFGNVAVRVTYANVMDVYLRESGKKYFAHVLWHPSIGLTETTIGSAKSKDLTGDLELPAGYKKETEHELVFAAQGDVLSLWIDGREIGTVRDGTLREGTMSVVLHPGPDVKPSRFRKVEYGELPDATPAARLSPSAEPWQDVLRDPAKLVLTGAVERTPEGLRFTDVGGTKVAPGQSPKGDGAVRIITTFGGLCPQLYARNTKSDGNYQLYVMDAKTILFNRWDSAKSKVLHAFPLREALQPGQNYELELRAVGQTFTAKLNGEILGTVTDGALSEGPFGVGVGVGVHDAAPVLVKAVEVLDLDAPGSSSATPATATKDKPFVNTLGMKFVPVPIGGGPTKGQPVLFGVWDVRVQDYAAYAAGAGAKKVDDGWTRQQRDNVPAGRELNHPVVGVSWEDAQAFCQWLTEKEQAEGKLPKGLKYRLPSDEEWSWAVGLLPESGGTPAEKSGKNSVDFPWGKDWPPTKKVGNYADETFHGKFLKDATDKTKDQPWIVGYDDGYATTSPVGSFPANAYGLYDMGGNVWQWCEDWLDDSHKDRVLRGAAWGSVGRGRLLSSGREHSAPADRRISNGFRCVLAPADSTRAPTGEVLPFGGHRYQLVLAPSNWQEAKAKAEAMGGHLATFTSDAEELWMRDHFVASFGKSDHRFWIGGFAAEHSRDIRWVTGEPVGKLRWAGGNPGWRENASLAEVKKNGILFAAGISVGQIAENGGWAVIFPVTSPNSGFIVEWDDHGMTSAAAPAGGWISLMDKIDPAADAVKGKWSRVEDGVRGEVVDGFGTLQLPYEPPQEYDFRVVFTAESGSAEAMQFLAATGHQFRWTTAGGGSPGKWAGFSNDNHTNIADSSAKIQLSAPPMLNRRYESLVEVRRDHATGYIDGKKMVEWKTDYSDLRLASAFALRNPGCLGIGFFLSKLTFHDISVRDVTGTGRLLRGAPLASASSGARAAATKDKPFVNTLGMKFVPVPGTRVLFSIWDTRVKDYAEFARVNVVDEAWKKQEMVGVPAGRDPDHPVVGVRWNDANAFCKWLTEKESKDGKLPQGMKYRLPTDEEWSRAVGLAKEGGATPKERSERNMADYPWGTGFPPSRPHVGNYADKSFHDKFPQERWIEGYMDGFPTTSPVASFAPNQHGLYDMGGNVWQWCEDAIEPSSAERVTRGASFDNMDNNNTRSARRLSHNYTYRHFDIGFRCVLSESAR